MASQVHPAETIQVARRVMMAWFGLLIANATEALEVVVVTALTAPPEELLAAEKAGQAQQAERQLITAHLAAAAGLQVGQQQVEQATKVLLSFLMLVSRKGFLGELLQALEAERLRVGSTHLHRTARYL
jgi:hypothetical protein